MKMKTKDSTFLKFFEGHNVKKEVKLKTPTQMTKLLELTRKTLQSVLTKARRHVEEKDLA